MNAVHSGSDDLPRCGAEGRYILNRRSRYGYIRG